MEEPNVPRKINFEDGLTSLLKGVDDVQNVINALEQIASALNACMNAVKLEVEKLRDKLT